MANDTLFRATAPRFMRQLMADFAMTAEDAAAVFGNAGHESNGFNNLQEIKPTVPSSRGGWGWFQWTGPRRRAFEAYCERNKLDPAAPETNYAWLFVELSGSEKRAVAAVKNAVGLRDKVIAFEGAYERAGVKHYDSRLAWAQIALEALSESDVADPVPSPPPEGKPSTTPAVAGGIGAVLTALVTLALKLLGFI